VSRSFRTACLIYAPRKIARWMRSRYSVFSAFRQCWCATPSKAVAIGLFCCSPVRALSAPPMGSFKALGRSGCRGGLVSGCPYALAGRAKLLITADAPPEVIPNRHDFPRRIGIPLTLRCPI
jgi:hypothetical protein